MEQVFSVISALSGEAAVVDPARAVAQAVRASAGYPVASSAGGGVAALRLEHAAFAEATAQQRARALELLRRVVECVEPGAGRDVVDDVADGGGGDAAIEFLDRLRESAETAIDEARGQHSSQQVAVIQGQLAAAGGGGGRGAGAPRRAPVAKAMAKPQERFEVAVDNARDTPFVPPAGGGAPATGGAGTPAYRASQLAPALPPAAFAPLDAVECTWVDTPGALMDMLDYLEGTGAAAAAEDDAAIRLPRDPRTGAAPVAEVALDLEAHSLRSFQGFCCLLQLSTRRRDYLVDTLALRAHLGALNRVTAYAGVLKVLHGCDSDVVWLQRDFGVRLCNVFDTGQAARVLGYPSFGLAHLLQRFAGVIANKEFQTADWRERPLPQELLKYAREDTHYLLPIYDRLKNELIDGSASETAVHVAPDGGGGGSAAGTDVGAPTLLATVLARSAEKATAEYAKDAWSPRAYRRLMVKLGMKPTPAGAGGRGGDADDADGGADDDGDAGAPASPRTRVFAALFDWRDATARAEDESTHYVLPNRLLGRLAETAPSNVDQLVRACNPMPPLVRARAGDVVAVVNRAVAATGVEPVGGAGAAAGGAARGDKRPRGGGGGGGGGSLAEKRPRPAPARATAAAAAAPSAAVLASAGMDDANSATLDAPGGVWLALPLPDGPRLTKAAAVRADGGCAGAVSSTAGSASAAFDVESSYASAPRPAVAAAATAASRSARCFDDDVDVVGAAPSLAAAAAASQSALADVVRSLRRASLLSLLGVQTWTPPPPPPAPAPPAAPALAGHDAEADAGDAGDASGPVAPAHPALLAAAAGAAHAAPDGDILSLQQRFKRRRVIGVDAADGAGAGGSIDDGAGAAAPAPRPSPAAASAAELTPFDYAGAGLHVRGAIAAERQRLAEPAALGGRGRGGKRGRGSNPYLSGRGRGGGGGR